MQPHTQQVFLSWSTLNHGFIEHHTCPLNVRPNVQWARPRNASPPKGHLSVHKVINLVSCPYGEVRFLGQTNCHNAEPQYPLMNRQASREKNKEIRS